MAKQRVKEVRKGGGGKILAFLLGILMGIILIVGALGGAAYYVWNKPIKSTVKLIDGEENGKIYQMLFDESKGYLDPSYASKKVGSLIKDVTDAVSALGSGGSLNDLQAISPKVGSTVDKLLKTTDKYGVPITKEEIMGKPVDELTDYLTTQLKETPLGGLLKVINGEETTEPLLLALCYGQEGVDYTKNEAGEIVMLGDAKATTVNGLLGDGGITELMDRVTLESVSGDFNKDDAIMRAIAYGSANRYTATKDADGKITDITMKQMQFTFKDWKLYDIDGKEVTGTFDVGNKTLVEGEVTYYLKQIDNTPVTYAAYADAGLENAVFYSKTTINALMGDASSLVDGLYLSDAMEVNGSSHEILISLAYGDEGVDYIRNGEEIIPINSPRTLGDLKENSTELINDIRLGDAIGVKNDDSASPVLRALAYAEDGTPRTLKDLNERGEELIDGIYLTDALNVNNASHKVLISLAYGDEGVDYTIDGDGNIVLKEGVKPRTLGELKEKNQELIDGILLVDALGINDDSHPVLRAIAYDKTTGDPISLGYLSQHSDEIINGILLVDALGVTPDMHPVLKSIIVEGTEGVDYQIVPDGDGYKIEAIGGAELNFRTLEDLSNDSDSIIGGILLTDALKIDENSHSVLRAIAYDEQGKPRTLNELSENSDTIIGNIHLVDALSINPDTHPVLKSIMIEGVYGEDYDLVSDGNGGYTVEVTPGRTVTYRTLDELSNDSDRIINGILVADALSVTPQSDKILITLAYGKEGKDYKVEGGKIVMLGDSKPRDLSDLSGDIGTILDDVTLEDVMDPDFDTPIVMYMLYGREDVHYKVVETGGVKSVAMLQQRVAIYGDKVYNPYGEEIVGTLNTTAKTFTVDGVTYKYKDTPVEAMTNTTPLELADGTLVSYSYLYIEENGSDAPVYYEAISIGDLSSEEGEENHLSLATARLTVKEMLGGTTADDNFLLRHVEDYTIDELPEAIENLRFTDVYARDIYKTEKKGEETYFVKKDGSLTTYNVDEKLTDEQKAELVVTSTWWYLLHNDAECHDSNCPDGASCSLYYDGNPNTVCTEPRGCQISSCGKAAAECHALHCHDAACDYKTGGTCTELPDCSRKGCIHDYKITDFDNLVTNMTNNMQDATLLCLNLDGIVSLTDTTLNTELESELSATIDIGFDQEPITFTQPIADLPLRADGVNYKVRLYELTISEILTYASNVLQAVAEFEEQLNDYGSGN